MKFGWLYTGGTLVVLEYHARITVDNAAGRIRVVAPSEPAERINL